MKTVKQEFNDYKVIHNFNYPNEPLKKWINEGNFINNYKEDWSEIMEVVEKIEYIGASIIIGRMFCDIKYINPLDQSKTFEKRMVSGVKINALYGALIEFIKWYNTINK